VTTRTIAWTGVEEWLAEVADVGLVTRGVSASGTQLGADPHPYRADYRLDARDGWITRRLDVSVRAAGGARTLALEHDGGGAWTVDGVHAPALDGALDCDLALSPLTNLMPVRRHALHEGGQARDFAMAWVSLPGLAVHRSPQRYEPLRPGVVRYVALDADFIADLELDADGLVLVYPRLARRVAG
jgi:uncharacterized protein